MAITSLILGLVAIGLFYKFMTWNFDYWIKRKVPGPSPKVLSIFTNFSMFKRHPLYGLINVYNQYKEKYDAVGLFGGRLPQLLIINPELARRVFVADFRSFHDNEVAKFLDEKSDYIFANNPFSLTGKDWKDRRAEVTPGLTMGRIKTVYPVTNNVCQKMSEWITKQIRLGSSGTNGVDAKDLSLRFTSEMVTDSVLGLSAESFSDSPTPVMSYIKEMFVQPWSFIRSSMLVSSFPLLSHLIKVSFVPRHVEQFFQGLMARAIEARRSQMADDKKFQRTDLLEYIMQLAEKKDLDTRQLLTRMMSFLLGGIETTGGVLAHMLLLLGRHQEAQQRLREEILPRLRKGIIPFDEINNLQFLDACMQESIRLFPPSSTSSRLCTETIELPNKDGPNFVVDKGTTVIVPLYCFMQDEDYFPDPQAFKPDRFMEPDAAKKYRESGVFMGFADGPRICIGMRFATVQVKAAIVEILSNFNVRVNPKTRKDNEFEPIGVLTDLRGGVWLDFEKLH
nr:probable cytochrome P450 28a5 [Drosophila bipectinata]